MTQQPQWQPKHVRWYPGHTVNHKKSPFYFPNNSVKNWQIFILGVALEFWKTTRKVVRRSYSREVGNLTTVWLQISSGIWILLIKKIGQFSTVLSKNGDFFTVYGVHNITTTKRCALPEGRPLSKTSQKFIHTFMTNSPYRQTNTQQRTKPWQK